MTTDRAADTPGSGLQLVTVSATYGAGGSVVGPALAQQLGVPFLERVTTSTGQPVRPEHPGRAHSGSAHSARRWHEHLTDEEARATPVHRLLAAFTEAMPTGPTLSPPSTHHQDRHLRSHGEDGIHHLLAGGGGVILGRAAAVVLGKGLGFHVRLDGPAGARAAQGAVIEDISEEQARARLGPADKIRAAYVRRLYRRDPADASLYHLVIDSTAMPLDAVTERSEEHTSELQSPC